MNAQLMDQARAAYRAGDFSSAAQLFASAKTADEICGEADHLRGNSLMRLGLFQDAAEAYSAALRDASYGKSGALLTNQGKALAAAGDLAGAANSFGLAVQSLDIQYIDTADNGLDFLFHGNTFEDLLITDQGYDLGSDLCLDDGKLGATHHLRCLIDHHLGKTGIFHFHAFLINDQHGYGLLVGI